MNAPTRKGELAQDPGASARTDLSQFYAIFFEEASEHLTAMESLLLQLDPANASDDDLNAIFRAAHSNKVQTGTKLVEAAGATMDEIVTSVKRVSDIIAEITAASQEQASGIEQVGQAVTQVDQVTQQNAALVEQSAAAAESMRDQAAAMAQTVGVFVVDGAATLPPGGTSLKPAPTNGSGSKALHASRPTPASARTASAKAPAMSTSEDEWEEF